MEAIAPVIAGFLIGAGFMVLVAILVSGIDR